MTGGSAWLCSALLRKRSSFSPTTNDNRISLQAVRRVTPWLSVELVVGMLNRRLRAIGSSGHAEYRPAINPLHGRFGGHAILRARRSLARSRKFHELPEGR